MTDAPLLPLQQHPHFAAALTVMGRQVRFLDLPGAAPVLAVKQFGQLLTSRGPVWTEGHGPDAQTLRQSRLRVLNAESADDTALRQAGYRMITTPAHVAELDLTGTPHNRIDRAGGKWRNIWRRAQETGIALQWQAFDPAQHAWLFAADRAQQRQKRFRALPHALISAYALQNPRDALVLIALEDDTAIAAMLFLLHAPGATYHLGWSNTRGRRLGAHHQMIMMAAQSLATRGCTRLDLGSIDTETAPGLARFKIGTGAQVRALGGTWLRVPGL